jgi:arylsulfatase A-like enzyme
MKPNILFVFSDQHRWCDLGCYGNGQVHSPALDRFAAEGVRCNGCFSNSPLCVPARGGLLTGLFPLGHGAVGNDLPIRTEVTSVAHVLKAGGYRTGYVGKWHLAGVPRDQSIPPGAGRLGFDHWKVTNCIHDYLHSYYDDEQERRFPIPGYEPTAQTDLAIDFIDGAQEKPWALWLSWGPPHDPYRAVPEKWLRGDSPEALELRGNVQLPVRKSPAQAWDEDELRRSLQGYYAHISALDHEFGRLLEVLERSGQAENTLVVYTSDHGDMLGSHGLADKQLPYEESIHVPLLLRWPARIKPGVRDQLLGLVDLPVTVAGLAGLAFPGETDGRDLSRVFTDPASPGREAVYLVEYTACHQAHARPSPAWRAIRTATHLFAKTADGKPWLLFDLINDPLEQHNLLEDGTSPLAAKLEAELDALVARHDAYRLPEDLLVHYGFEKLWNRSQREFHLPEIARTG